MPSPQLMEAQVRLLQLQAAARLRRDAERPSTDLPAPAPADAALPKVIACLPAHLGWGSAPLTRLLRTVPPELATAVAPVLPHTTTVPPSPSPETAVKLYPDIGLAMLRQNMTAPGRLWLLLHHLDAKRQGWVRIAQLRDQITTQNSATFLCGKRQLRNLLKAGEGLFWQRDRERVWLRSAAKVAAALGVARLSGQPVALPLRALLESIGAFRANLYAAFHSGRQKKAAQPIARATLQHVSGAGKNSQRAYERRVGLVVQRNFAIGAALTNSGKTAHLEEQVWQQGTAVFQLHDRQGNQGQPGAAYMAWQLPNSYETTLRQQPKGRQRHINRELKDLVNEGTPGNVGGSMGCAAADGPPPQRRYFENGRTAVLAVSRQQGTRYWRGRRYGRAGALTNWWHAIG